MGKAYKWSFGGVPVDAQTAGEYMEGLANKYGMLTPKLLVDESREVGAVMHECFEWDDAIAAEGYRERQASDIIRNLKVTIVIEDKPSTAPIRAFVNVVDAEKEKRGYVQTYVAMGKEDFRTQILNNAYYDLCCFKKRYEQYAEVAEDLQPVFSAIDQLSDKFQNLQEEAGKWSRD